MIELSESETSEWQPGYLCFAGAAARAFDMRGNTVTDEERFAEAKNKILGKNRERSGIGTLSEKTVHVILKHYYAPDESMHEIGLEGCVADVYTGSEIMEIQTGNFDRLRGKLERFLPLYPVTVIYPIPHDKWLIWIDEKTGEMSGKRKSPLHGSAYLAFKELYKIKNVLTNRNLRLRLVLLDMEEYRLLNGWSRDRKKGSSRYDRIPVRLAGEVCIDCPQDYLQLLPYDLPEVFTARQFGKQVHIPDRLASLTLHVLHHVGVVERVGKRGNAYEYRVKEEA